MAFLDLLIQQAKDGAELTDTDIMESFPATETEAHKHIVIEK